MSAILDRWLTRLYRLIGSALVLAACGFVSYTAGDWHWPYHVLSAELSTPEVAPGGTLRQTRVIRYRAECEIRSERRLQSTGPEGRRVMLPQIAFGTPPWDRDGKPQTTETEVPADFPCGPATIVESPSAACNWVQRILGRQHKADVITPFRVVCAR
ncbi:hypothetical protein [Methylobacterium trifolii]|uniref:Uncharacterized protein n=1 Tax=Methylobacterium trifolii TaxID=1003092 RepID=A0ABQ4TY22_9HYPH|nr:hypothetical protein [Methylobacterium trifolii]GJE59747.1 hypothetical protein MPOCJGCO_1849 [Methylobacterium trifolii]